MNGNAGRIENGAAFLMGTPKTTPLQKEFSVEHRTPKPDLMEAIEDTLLFRNLNGPYKTVREAMNAMLND